MTNLWFLRVIFGPLDNDTCGKISGMAAPELAGVRVNSPVNMTFTFRAFGRHFYTMRFTIYKSICQKKEKQRYISVGTARMFIEPGAKHLPSLG